MKNSRLQILAILAILLFIVSLSACGQKGDLILPDDEKAAKKKKSGRYK